MTDVRPLTVDVYQKHRTLWRRNITSSPFCFVCDNDIIMLFGHWRAPSWRKQSVRIHYISPPRDGNNASSSSWLAFLLNLKEKCRNLRITETFHRKQKPLLKSNFRGTCRWFFFKRIRISYKRIKRSRASDETKKSLNNSRKNNRTRTTMWTACKMNWTILWWTSHFIVRSPNCSGLSQKNDNLEKNIYRKKKKRVSRRDDESCASTLTNVKEGEKGG